MAGRGNGPLPLAEILKEFNDPHEAIRIAAAILRFTEDLKLVSTALVERGIHPLSLVTDGDEDLQKWITSENHHGWRFHARGRYAQSELYWGNLRLQRFHFTIWFRQLPPDLKLVISPSVETLVLSDSCLSGLFRHDMTLDTHLKVLACAGVSRLPSRVGGRLQLHFSEARFHFPKQMNLDGILEIRGCPGIEQLPETLQTSGLLIDHCPNIRALPKCIRGARQMDLVALPIDSIEQEIEGLSYLRIAHCRDLNRLTLPSGASLDVDLALLPALFDFDIHLNGSLGDLSIHRCDGLESLPDNLRVLNGSLSLQDLPQLTRLPKDLMVAKDLQIHNCPELRTFPNGFSVAGDVEIEGCPLLQGLPNRVQNAQAVL